MSEGFRNWFWESFDIFDNLWKVCWFRESLWGFYISISPLKRPKGSKSSLKIYEKLANVTFWGCRGVGRVPKWILWKFWYFWEFSEILLFYVRATGTSTQAFLHSNARGVLKMTRNSLKIQEKIANFTFWGAQRCRKGPKIDFEKVLIFLRMFWIFAESRWGFYTCISLPERPRGLKMTKIA